MLETGSLTLPFLENGQVETIANTLAEQGWIVLPDFFSPDKVHALREQALRQRDNGGFHAAGTGRGPELRVNESIRGDQVQWLEHAEEGALADYQKFAEELRLSLNSLLYYGLFEFEAHFAVYPPGAFYQQHLDNFWGSSTRVISTILYLNEDWQETDCGQLRLYTDGTEGGEYVDIFPQGGQLVIFRSTRFWHEVLPTRRERVSITGWFRRRNVEGF